MTSRKMEVELQFDGDGVVRLVGAGAFSGGVIEPAIGGRLSFTLHRQVADEDGLVGPVPGEVGIGGSLQLNLFGTSEGYQELGRFFLALAVLDSSVDPGHHMHFDEVRSADGQTSLDIIVRKEIPLMAPHNHALQADDQLSRSARSPARR